MDRIAMVALFSEFPEWRERRQILRDIGRQRAATALQSTFYVDEQLIYAKTATRRGDRLQALEIWNRVLELHPNEARKSEHALEILLVLGQFDEAEKLMRQGVADYPGDPTFLTGLAHVANSRGEEEECLKRCKALRKRFPDVIDGYLMAVDLLRRNQRFDEADLIAKQALKRCQSDPRTLLNLGNLACDKHDWSSAVKYFQRLIDHFADQRGYMGMARALEMLGRDDEADALLTRTGSLFPGNSAPFVERARLAQRRGYTPIATSLWLTTATYFPNELATCLDAATQLEALGAPNEAERLLREAARRFL